MAGGAGSRARVAVVAVAIVVAAGMVGAHRLALGDLRRVEAIYIESRQPSSCVMSELSRRIDPDNPRTEIITDELPAMLERANGDVDRVASDAEATDASWFPPARRARAAVVASTRASGAFYAALVSTPDDSGDELDRYRKATTAAQRRLVSARRWLLVAPGRGWDERARCGSGGRQPAS